MNNLLRKTLPLLCCAASVALTGAHAADPPVPKAPVPEAPVPEKSPVAPAAAGTLQVSAQSYPLRRVGDLAPNWAFTLENGRRLDSRNLLGQQSQLLLIEDVPPTNLPLAVKRVSEAISNLWKGGTAVVMVSAKAGAVQGLDDETGVLMLRDNERLLQMLLGAGSLAVVDQFGFIRETVPFSALPAEPALLARELSSRAKAPLEPQIDRPAPDFSLPDMNGHARRVSDLRGRRNLLLTFFPKCFTGGCANHLTSLQASLEVFAANDTEIWAVSVDPAGGEAGQIAFANKLGLRFPLIPDEGRNLSFLYGAASKPTDRAARMSVLIDKEGIVRAIDRAVRVATHGEDVLKQMAALGMLKAQ